MRLILLPIILACLLSSCTWQKRLYRPGFALFQQGKASSTDKIVSQRAVRTFSPSQNPLDSVSSETTAYTEKQASFGQPSSRMTLQKTSTAQNSLHFTKHIVAKRSVIMVAPNSVPKAGFRTFIYSLILFGGALYCFFNLSGLVYVTAGLLIMAFVFCLVSLLTSVSARNDKINNSGGWVTMSLITLLIDILEIAAIAIFFIALF